MSENDLRSVSEDLRLEDRLRLGEAATGIGTFSLDLDNRIWDWSAQAAFLLGCGAGGSSNGWENSVFGDDLLKIHAAVDNAPHQGNFNVEFRVRHADGSLHWLAAKGRATPGADGSPGTWRGALHEITDRKALEARLLSVNETLEARVAEVREEARTLELLNQTGVAVAAEHDLERLVQLVTDVGVELSHAAFGAFFYNVLNESGESYTLYTISGVPREAFSKFPMPRNTAIFEPTFRGAGPVRSNDILLNPRYGKSAPHHGMPEGHLPVRSYLALPVVSRAGEVLGGLFFGHPQPGVFTERAERIVTALAAQAAVAIDNARLHQANQREIAARTAAEEELKVLNQSLERRAEERAQELARSLLRLEDTERRFLHFVEGVTDYAIYMLDPEGRVVNWNAGAERAKGYGRHEIVGRHFSTFYTLEDREIGLPQKALATAAGTGKYEVRRLAGEERPNQVLGECRYQCDQGRCRCAGGICQDHPRSDRATRSG